MSEYHDAKRAAGAAIRKSVPAQKIRFPRLFRIGEIETMPRISFSPGNGTAAFISREREGSRYFSVGMGYAAADAADVEWQATSWDEAIHCVSGRLVIQVTDAEGAVLDFTVETGDYFWAPAGYKYTVGTGGAESVSCFVTAPQMPSGWRHTGDDESYSDLLIGMRSQ